MMWYTPKEWYEICINRYLSVGLYLPKPENFAKVERGELPLSIIGKQIIWRSTPEGPKKEIEGIDFYIGDTSDMHLQNKWQDSSICGQRLNSFFDEQIYHAIGFDLKNRFILGDDDIYWPWRNWFTTDVFNPVWVRLKVHGYANNGPIDKDWRTTYYITDSGFRWLENELQCKIYADPEFYITQKDEFLPSEKAKVTTPRYILTSESRRYIGEAKTLEEAKAIGADYIRFEDSEYFIYFTNDLAPYSWTRSSYWYDDELDVTNPAQQPVWETRHPFNPNDLVYSYSETFKSGNERHAAEEKKLEERCFRDKRRDERCGGKPYRI